MLKCTYCGRENSDDAGRCHECGSEIGVSQDAGLGNVSTVGDEDPHRKAMIRGALWCGGGILVTALTYLSAASSPYGGTYVVAWGAILFGGWQFVRGMTKQSDRPRTMDENGYDLLSAATRLEAKGQVLEALKIYRQLAETHRNTELGRDAQKSLESLEAKRG